MKNHPSACTDFSENQISAHLHLLSAQDPKIAQTIHEQIVAIGQPAISFLEQAHREQNNLIMSERLSAVLADIKLVEIEQSFKALTTNTVGLIDLEMCAFLIGKAAYPDLNIQTARRHLETVISELQQQWGIDLSPRESIHKINKYLFRDLGFKGNTRNYYDPDNSFLHQVLERRVGIPISLSVLYLLIGQRLNVPVVGIGLPGHFMVGLQTESVLIDCFNQGMLLTQKDCAKFLQEYNIEFEARYLEPVPNHHIIARMLRNLVAIYQNRDEPKQADQFHRLLSVVESIDTTSSQG